jgi:hypothetical protein
VIAVRLPDYLKRHEGSIQTWSASLSHIAQVIALLLAGIWTYRTFYLSENPGLEPRGEASVDLHWDAFQDSNDICLAVLTVRFHNMGKRSIDVRNVRIIGWLSDRLSSVPGPRFIDSHDLEHGLNFFDQTLPKSHLIDHYPPDADRHEGFVWYFQKQPKKFAYFKVELETEPPQAGNATAWKDVCINE